LGCLLDYRFGPKKSITGSITGRKSKQLSFIFKDFIQQVVTLQDENTY